MTNRAMHKLAGFINSPKGAKLVIISWLIVIIVLSAAAPGAKPYAQNTGEGSIHNDTPSAIAEQIMDEHFPSDDGLTALLVFYGQSAVTDQEKAKLEGISEWLASDSKPSHISNSLPFHLLPLEAQNQLYSEDRTTVILNVTLNQALESDQIYETLQQIRSYIEQTDLGTLQFEITGPASIASDTISLFKNADLVLMFATIGLILIILIIIYRSPLLAIVPLVIAGMVYQVVDRILGLAAKQGWFIVDKQALSIMMILLFAVLTDYCLFIFSRYREELGKASSKYEAMRNAWTHVAEPILFSGGTVLIAMLTLFTALFKPYHHFAPVFSVAMIIILLGGLTLIPAVFALIGRRVFWPFVPKLDAQPEIIKTGFWTRTGVFITRKPTITACILLLLLTAASLNAATIQYSFNLMKSFPSDTPSRQGFEILEQRFPPGQLAPVTVFLKSDSEIELSPAFIGKVTTLISLIEGQSGVSSITPKFTTEQSTQPAATANFLSKSKHALKLQLTLQSNPYDQSSLDVLAELRDNEQMLLDKSGFPAVDYSLHYGGQTAEQLDVRSMNQRDTLLVFSLITVFILIMLALQARSIVLAIAMLVTMLLSYCAALGLGWGVFHLLLGYDSMSYRLPMYTFIFLIALGVDYNIMLVSRIKEEAWTRPWKEAVSRGVALTGGVISSAGVILAATFCVLITQPLQELFLFGFIMAIGIVMDTFLVRGMLLPAVMTLLGNPYNKSSHRQPEKYKNGIKDRFY
ncbi:MAG: hypothetical protein K0R67_816 [Paenibacillus sp.]|nr:hypothetical protein [Paenibacillus sp.]